MGCPLLSSFFLGGGVCVSLVESDGGGRFVSEGGVCWVVLSLDRLW